MTDIKVKLIAISKDEAAYIPQWVFHHLSFGFDGVEIWVNNTSDNSSEVLSRLQDSLGKDIVEVVWADDFFAECKEADKFFQPEVYNKVYRREKELRRYTHLMFLDLDEFWTPANFHDSVKDMIRKQPDSDVIASLWMFDMPDSRRLPFVRPFDKEAIYQKNPHVKSLVKISDNIRSIAVHVALLKKGALHLSDGTAVEDDVDAKKVNWAYIGKSQFRERMSSLEEYSIIHHVYRSPVEYLSSLLRGRSHANDDNVFKINRIGYIPWQGKEAMVRFPISTELVEKYDAAYEKFINKCDLADNLKTARRFVLSRYKKAIDILKSDPSLIEKYKNQLRGLDIETRLSLPDVDADAFLNNADMGANQMNSTVDGVVDSVQVDGGEIVVNGWIIEDIKKSQGNFEIRINDSMTIPASSFEAIHRPDVIKARNVFDEAMHCGFRAKFTPSDEIGAITAVKLLYASNPNDEAASFQVSDIVDSQLKSGILKIVGGEIIKTFSLDGLTFNAYGVSPNRSGIAAYCIDEPAPDRVNIEDRSMVVSGWAICADGKSPAGVSVEKRGEPARIYHFNRARPDVMKAYEQVVRGLAEDARYGFRLKFSVAEPCSISFIVDGKYFKVLDVNVETHNS
ncbi:glycosyltransferase family 2 protein [Burkholderia anthina]|uniref:glycosyltransferase family 2 protein n=1 Tax=Burkholderia anthina TaxID=179879 RepID=UPI00158B7915|nr:glycosyltransferase family 2 protein [Burkholderia anthina]